MGDLIHCTRFFAERCTQSKNLFGVITDVAEVDPRVAFSLLHLYVSFCKHVLLSRTTLPSICSVLKLFDEDVRSCLTSSLPVNIPDSNWSQAKLSPNMGGLGLHSLSGHSPAAFISSLATSRFGSPNNIHLQQVVAHFNSHVSQHDTVTVEKVSPTSE